jgi:hypothetical protein
MKKILITKVLNKTYRIPESKRKIFFILKNTNITMPIIEKAAQLIEKNEYHNFDHELGAAEMGIKIAQEEGYTKTECTEIVFAILLHDAGHPGFLVPGTEKLSASLIDPNFSEAVFESMQLYKEYSLKRIQFNILATVFADRGTSKNPDAHIMQDADLAHIGQGPYYWLWASMGLIDEFNKLRTDYLTPTTFIKEEQRKLLEYLQKCSPDGKSNGKSIWLSEGAQQLFNNPWDDIDEIESWSEEVYNYAYRVRFMDITLSEFKKQVLFLKKLHKKVA